VRVDEGLVVGPLCADHLRHGVQQQQVGAGDHLQVDIAVLGRRRAARIHGDDPRLGTPTLAAEHALEDRGVALHRVRPHEEEAVRVIEVLVGAARLVLAERLHVAEGGRSHAQPRIAVDVVRATSV
jgi:hypothetical protein